MTKPIPDKAEVAIEFPEKLYIGTFERTARFAAHFDEAGIAVTLRQSGSAETRKTVSMHFHDLLFAEILGELARSADTLSPAHEAHRDALRDAAEQLSAALSRSRFDDLSTLTPEDEVRLLHVLE
jgi:hypothetical protein